MSTKFGPCILRSVQKLGYTLKQAGKLAKLSVTQPCIARLC